jgi:ATP-dependent RNA helicase RhlE
MSFQDLGLIEPLVRAVAEQGYTVPTPIQQQAIPVVLAGHDLLAAAQTGTGKTAGFTLPMLQRLSGGESARNAKGKVIPRALILTPTRELAAQVHENLAAYGRHLKLHSMAMYGGVGMQPQINALARGMDIVVATPGRLLDHQSQRNIDLSAVQMLVLDEADRMLDMGFVHDMRRIVALLPKQRQNLLFSATFSEEIKRLAGDFLVNPQQVAVARQNATADLVEQIVFPVDRERKRDMLVHLIRERNWPQTLVFTRTKHGANRLAEQLDKDGIVATGFHGNKTQSARLRALADFKSGKLQVLVATDIAARGIDIDQLPVVVNYELPNIPEDYVHRIGRTGRAGSNGQAISLVCVDELGFLRDIEKLVRNPITQEVIPGFEPDPNAKAQPIVMGRTVLHGGERRGGGGGGGGGQGQRRNGSGAGNGGHRGAGRNAPGQGRAPAPSSAKPQGQRGSGRPAKPAAGAASNLPPERRADAWQGTSWVELDLPPHMRGGQGRGRRPAAGGSGQPASANGNGFGQRRSGGGQRSR